MALNAETLSRCYVQKMEENKMVALDIAEIAQRREF